MTDISFKFKNRQFKSGFSVVLFLIIAAQLCVFIESIPKLEYIYTAFLLFSLALLWNFKPNKESFVYALSLFFILVLGTCFSLLYGLEGNLFLAFPIAINCLLYMSIACNYRIFLNKKNIADIFKIFTYIGVVACIYNLIANRNDIIGLNVGMNEYMAIFCSFYSGRNTFANFLLMFIVSSSYLYSTTRKKMYIAFIILMLINLFFTFSRTSIISALLFLALFFMLDSGRKLKRILPVLLIITILVYLGYGIVMQNFDIIDHFLIREGSGEQTRFSLWSITGDYFLKSPFFGYGAGSATFILKEEESHVAELVNSFHNTYIEIAMWGGIALVFLYCKLYVRIYRSIKYIKKIDASFYNVYIPFFISILAFSFSETFMFFAMGVRPHTLTALLIVVPLLYSHAPIVNSVYKKQL